jgi:hypothetical protein
MYYLGPIDQEPFHSDISLAFTYLLSRSSLQLNLENNCNAGPS